MAFDDLWPWMAMVILFFIFLHNFIEKQNTNISMNYLYGLLII